MDFVVTTRGSRLNVRSGPGMQHGIVHGLANGARVSVGMRAGEWAKIAINQWVHASFLSPVGAADVPAAAANLPYAVPGFRVVLAQPTGNTCWATVYCMMRSWKSQSSLGIREAAGLVGAKYALMVDKDNGLPASEFGPFIQAANMAVQPMMNLTIPGWVNLLRRKGLIWVGTLNSIGPGSGLHSRIIESMSGDGSVNGTRMHIIDPAGGRRYQETFVTFIAKYEGALGRASRNYFQIRHFR